MFYYQVETKDGRTHGGCSETREEVLETLCYLELTYSNPDVASVNVYEK